MSLCCRFNLSVPLKSPRGEWQLKPLTGGLVVRASSVPLSDHRSALFALSSEADCREEPCFFFTPSEALICARSRVAAFCLGRILTIHSISLSSFSLFLFPTYVALAVLEHCMEQTGCKLTEIHLPLEDSLVLGLKVCITVPCDSISLIGIQKAVLRGSPLAFVYFKKSVHFVEIDIFGFLHGQPKDKK